MSNTKNWIFFPNLWKRLLHCHLKGQYFKIKSTTLYHLQVHNQISSSIILPIVTVEKICKLVFKVLNFLLRGPCLHLDLHRNLENILFTVINYFCMWQCRGLKHPSLIGFTLSGPYDKDFYVFKQPFHVICCSGRPVVI